jgi:hypothetical protein
LWHNHTNHDYTVENKESGKKFDLPKGQMREDSSVETNIPWCDRDSDFSFGHYIGLLAPGISGTTWFIWQKDNGSSDKIYAGKTVSKPHALITSNADTGGRKYIHIQGDGTLLMEQEPKK